MAKHSWKGVSPRQTCLLHPSPPAAVQEYNEVDNENGTGGGTWQVVNMFGQVWIKLTLSSPGNGHTQRADLIIQDSPWGAYTDAFGNKGITALSQGRKGETTVYRHKFFANKASGEYKPVSGTNWNAICAEWHSSYRAWPGSSGPSINYLGNTLDFIPYAQWNGSSNQPRPFHGPAWQEGDLLMQMYGGAYASSQINEENRIFLSKGAWEQKVIDVVMKVHWDDNVGQAGAYSWNRHAPSDLANSGWQEIVYALGEPVRLGDGSIDFSKPPVYGPWTLYNPKFSAAGLNLDWENGPELGRHYSPTLAVGESAYKKWPNYRGDIGSANIPSSVYYADVEWADTYTDLSVPEIGSVSDVTAPSISSASIDGVTATLQFNESFDPVSIPDKSAFNVKANGNIRTINSLLLSGATITLVLAAPVISTDTMTWDYNKPPTGQLKDAAGNQTANVSGAAMINNTAPVVPTGVLVVGKNVVGPNYVGNEINYKRACFFPWPTDNPPSIMIDYAGIFLKGQTGAHGDVATERFLVHASDASGGGPGKRLAYSADTTLYGDLAPGWQSFIGANLIGVKIDRADIGGGGGVWLAEHYSGTNNVIATACDHVVGAQLLRTDLFSDGSSDPWSSSEGGGQYDGVYDNQFCFYILYHVVTPQNVVIPRTNAARVISAISRIVGGVRRTGEGGSL